MIRQMVDTHLHLWERSTFNYSWIDAGTTLDADFTAEQVEPQLRAAGVDSAVLVQVGDFEGDTWHMLELAERWPFISGVVGWVPLDDARRASELIDRYRQSSALKGVRCLSHDYADDTWMLQDAVQDGIDLLGPAGLTFDLVSTTSRHLANASVIARAHPDVRIVIDHLAKPGIAHDSWQPWADQIRDAAAHENVYIKLSGLNTVSPRGAWSGPVWQPYVDHALECFGAGRLMLGSDWPVATLDGDYVGVWRAQLDTLAHLSPSEQELILARTAEQFYSL